MNHCIICGAKLKSINSKVNTCKGLCTEAKRAGLSLEELIQRKEKEPFPEQDGTGCSICGCRWCICKEI